MAEPKDDADIEQALVELESGVQHANYQLSSILGRMPSVNCGQRVKPKPTLDQLDKWS